MGRTILSADGNAESLVSGINANTNELKNASMSITPISKDMSAEQFVSGLNSNFGELYNGQAPIVSDEYNIVYDMFDCLHQGNAYIQYRTGALGTVSPSGFCISDYLPVYGDKMIAKHSFTGLNAGVAFYDSSKNFISGFKCSSTEQEKTIPTNAAYIRISNKLPCRNWPMYVKMKTTDASALAARQADLDDPNRERTLNVLHLGNSYTANTMANLGSICSAIGVNKARVSVQYYYYASSSLAMWYNWYTENVQTFNLSNVYGTGNSGGTLQQIFSQHWDVVIFQQVSSSSGDYSTFQPTLNNLKSAVESLCPNPDVKVKFMMTWEKNSSNDRVPYADIVTANKELLADDSYNGWEFIGNIIPAGTAIQNIRGTSLNVSESNFSNDQHHLSPGVGQFTAGCCWYQSVIAPFSGKSIFEDDTTTVEATDLTGSVAVTSENRLLCQQAAMAACIDPWQVTSIDES